MLERLTRRLRADLQQLQAQEQNGVIDAGLTSRRERLEQSVVDADGALTRARDRLLERLLAKGLNMEYDLPTFLRYAGNQSGDRLRTVRTHLLDIRRRAHAFIEHSYHVTAQTDVGPDPETFKTWLRPEAEALTKAYCDLTFAFGLARLGETDECHKLHKTAESVFGVSPRED